MNNVDVIIGGQFGSEAKGQMAGWLAHQRRYDVVVSNSGSQAGHTFVEASDGDGLLTALLRDAKLRDDFKALVANLRSRGVLFYKDERTEPPKSAPTRAPASPRPARAR